MDTSTVTLVIGIISCIIGVSAFVLSLQSKAQDAGVLEQKIEQALQGIDEIKMQVKDSASNQATLSLIVQSHTEQLKTLYNSIDDLKHQVDIIEQVDNILNKILDVVKGDQT